MTATEVYRRHIPETKVEGKPLGRHVHHDPRSLGYQVAADGTVATARWARIIAILNQLNVGACTGNAATGHLGTQPEDATLAQLIAAGLTLDEAEALVLYSAAEVIDGDGPYPPNDNGSSGLSVAKAAQAAGLISGYKHMTSLAACQTAIQTGPFIIGINWYTSMDSPDANGLVTVSGTVRGGHEVEVIGYDASTDLWELANSWGESYGVNGYFFMSSVSLSRLLSEDGDATQFVPLSVPAPVPTPPQPTPFPEPTPDPPGPSPAPIPVPGDVDATYFAANHAWALKRHTTSNEVAAENFLKWATEKGFNISEHQAEHSAP